LVHEKKELEKEIKMSVFTVKEVLISDAILREEDRSLYRKLNVQLEVELEPIKDLRTHVPTTIGEHAKELGDAIAKALCDSIFVGNGDKKEIIIRPVESGFGWYTIEVKS
jgi:hypothetical protein